MESEWDWHWPSKGKDKKIGGKRNELWRIWWTICATRIERKIK